MKTVTVYHGVCTISKSWYTFLFNEISEIKQHLHEHRMVGS